MVKLKSLFSFHSIIIGSIKYLKYDISHCANYSLSHKKIMSKVKPNKISRKPTNSINSKKCRYLPSEIYLCVLGNGSKSSPRSLYLFTDHSRYLFNCGEGTQRLAQEYKMKLSKLEHVFITHKSWENCGGLLGLSLTIQDAGLSKIILHGPTEMNSLYRHSETFVYLKNLEIVSNEDHGHFCDDNIEVQKIPISVETSKESVSEHSSDSVKSSSSNESFYAGHKSKKLRTSTFDWTIAYACKFKNKQGQLLMEKCVEFGVPVGPLLGNLKDGKDVVLPSGKVILSKDVVSPEEVCPFFLVVECPSEKFLEPFVSESQFQDYQADATDPSKIASLVVHFTPSEILKSPLYQKWMQRFPSTTCHLILNEDCSTVNSCAVHRIQHQLNLLHPQMFSLLHEKEEVKKDISGMIPNTIQACTLERYNLRPFNGIDKNSALKLQPDEFIEEAMKAEGFEILLRELKYKIEEKEKTFKNGNLYPEIIFLGTGSSIPSKLRNVSAILVKTSEKEYILMDCGEGTYGQILRLFGDKNEDLLLHLSVIFISHMHADHHLGLITILKERKRIFNKLERNYEKIRLIGPMNLKQWLKHYSMNFENVKPLYKFVECSSLEHDELFNLHFENTFQCCPDLLISTVPVNHCQDAHGIIVSSKSSKWKLVYSGDTEPCNRLVIAGKDCSLLIHEATMEDDLANEAAVKRHCTTSQAIEIGKQMNAQYTLLTHFSQRYAKVPVFTENFHSLVGFAFDNMKVHPNELHILPLLIPALNCLFAEDVEDLHSRMQKRLQKSKLMESMLAES